MRWRRNLLIIFLVFTPILVTFVAATSVNASTSQEPRIIELTGEQFYWDPETVEVEVGETIIFRVIANDVAHGLYIDGFDITIEEGTVLPGQIKDVGPFVANRAGKFKIRCSVACGAMHPFMVADLIVKHKTFGNYPYLLVLGAIATTSVGSVAVLGKKSTYEPPKSIKDKGTDLLNLRVIGKPLEKLVRWRGFHYFLMVPSLFIFMIVILAGFFGNPMGGFNISIAVVWILWFAAVEVMVLLGSRLWCATCPLPSFGLWLSRRRTYTVREPRKDLSMGRTWPKKLRNMWIPTAAFMVMSLLSPWLVTQPFVSALLFTILIGTATVMHLVYGRERNFCLYVCPAGGYIGYHSAYSPLSVRSKDPAVCRKCNTKACMRGSPRGYGCPWKLYPGGNESNIYCGLDMECMKSCPHDNMTLKYQKFGKDMRAKIRTSSSEAWMGFTRFTLVIFYEFVLLGHIWWIKDWASMGVKFGANLATANLLIPTAGGFTNWIKWAILVISVVAVIVPAIFYAFAWSAHRVAGGQKGSVKKTFLAMSQSLSPFGLILWVAFALPLLFVNWAYPLRAFSDPFGWGWNLFGTGKLAWNPLFPDVIQLIQAVLVVIGLYIAIRTTHAIAFRLYDDYKKATTATAVMSIFHAAATVVFIWLLMG